VHWRGLDSKCGVYAVHIWCEGGGLGSTHIVNECMNYTYGISGVYAAHIWYQGGVLRSTHAVCK